MGFGAEVKDFINGFSTGQKIMAMRDDREYKKLRAKVFREKNSPERLKLEEDLLKARAERMRRGPDATVTEGRRLSNKLKRLQIQAVEDLRRRQAAGGNANAIVDQGPGYGENLPTDASAVPPVESEIPDPTQNFSHGGAVKAIKSYADGGSVEDDGEIFDSNTPKSPYLDPYADVPEDQSQQAVPVEDSSIDLAAMDQPFKGANKVYSPQASHDAVLAGIKFAQKQLGVTPQDAGLKDAPAPDQNQPSVTPGSAPGGVSPSPAASAAAYIAAGGRRKGAVAAYLSGAGMSTPEEIQAVYAKIDPQHRMSESERTFASMGAVYTFYLQKGDVKRAQSAAASLLQYYRGAYNRYSALAQAAAGTGDVTKTMRMLLKAHANVPDGIDMKLLPDESGKGIKYTFTDAQSGKLLEHAIMSPQQLLQWASKGTIQSFDELVTAAAGIRAQIKGGSHKTSTGMGGESGGVKPDKPSDAKIIRTEIMGDGGANDGAWNRVLQSRADASGKPPTVAPREASALQNHAIRIFGSHSNRATGVTPDQAVNIALAISGTLDAKPQQIRGEKVQSGGKTVGFIVKTTDANVYVPIKQYDELYRIRLDRLSKQREAVVKAEKEAGKSNLGSDVLSIIAKPFKHQPAGPGVHELRNRAKTPKGPSKDTGQIIMDYIRESLKKGEKEGKLYDAHGRRRRAIPAE